jgi:uncharacterized protein involved in response to NO
VGFRPFFALAFLAGMSLPVLWALMFSGAIAGPHTILSAVQWHAHEMFFGFGWAVLGGFLLTATKNWVRIRGFHGNALLFLAAAWCIERLGMWWQTALPPALFIVSANLFLGALVAMLLWTLWRHRGSDSFDDNYFFLLILPAFLIAKNLMLSPDHFQAGWGMTLALFRVAFLVMLERTVGQFMKGAFQVSILRNPLLDTTIKLLGVLLVVAGSMPPLLAGWISLVLASLLAGRMLFWSPHKAMRRIDIGILYLGYLAIVLQLLIEFATQYIQTPWVGAVSVHVFTFGAIGLIVPSMLIRISKGHTGRPVVFDALDKLALQIMLAAFVLRIVMPQLYPGLYLHWIELSAVCWFLCFATLAWRYLPLLARPRVDGKEH